MQLQTAQRRNAKIRLGLQGPSGSGKTMSALLIAFGITQDWSKIGVIDTESSSELYSHLGPYQVLQLKEPYSPERYIEALHACEMRGWKLLSLTAQVTSGTAQEVF
jgi:hypothetical protein